MYNYANNGITIASILDDRSGNSKGEYPVKIRVTYLRQRKYYSTGKMLCANNWEKLPETKNKTLIEIRKDIQNSFDIVKNAVQELIHEGGFSFDILNSRLSKSVSDTLNIAFKLKIENLKNNEQIGTAEYYKAALNSIEQFAGKNILLSSVSIDWLKKYEKYLLRLGRSYTSIGMYCRAIRHILNEARKTGIIKENQYPFGKGKYEISTGQRRKLALSLHQIKLIVSYTDGLETTERYRDLWLFSYLCNGINFSDMLRLKYSNIQDGEMCFLRGKTARTSKIKKEVFATITPEMNDIIKRWGNKDMSPNAYVFPYLSGNETAIESRTIVLEVIRRCNKRLKIISKALGIEKISTYTARHSYATVLKRSGANIAYISESLGHNDLKTTENYLASFEKEERIKNAALLTNFGDE